MIRRPPRATLTYTLFPYTTLFRSRTECLGSVDEVSEAAADTHGAVLFQPKVRPAAKLLVHHRECSLTALEAGFTARPYVGNRPVELLVQLREVLQATFNTLVEEREDCRSGGKEVCLDRKSVVSGKGVSVRVDPGGGRI